MKTLLTGKPYTNSAETDIEKTFRRIRREMKQAAESQAIADAEAKAKTVMIKERKKA